MRQKLLIILLMATLIPACAVAQEYKGSVEAGYDFIPDEDWGNSNMGKISVLTTHGAMLKPWLFVGAGTGVNVIPGDAVYVYFPVYADARVMLPGKVAQPYAEMRLGHTFGHIDKIYAHPSVGCRLSLTEKKALYFGVGYDIIKVWPEDENGEAKTKHGYLTFRLGFDF